MNYFDTLEKKREHVKKYDMNRIVPKQIIERALWKAWKTSPSKNNAMAYQCLVWGPHLKFEKRAIHSLVVKSHSDVEDGAVANKNLPEITKTQGAKLGVVENPFYEHVKLNPYLFTIHSRLSTPNRFYKEKVEQGHFYDQAYNPEDIIDSVAVEVGLFAANLGYYLLEEGLDISYNSCFKREVKHWHNVGLHMVEQRPINMISCGYAERYRKEELKKWGKDEWDIKPPKKDIIKWM